MVHDPLRTQPDDPGQAETDAEDAGGDPGGDLGGERVAKLLARAGVGSRRDVERLIAEGRVAVNGRALETPAVKVEAGDIVTVDGEVVGEPEPARLFRYHKPVGLVTTHKDPAGRPTVFAALPEGLPRLISVGRLDLNSEGLLLLTNDGELARALESPATGIVRRYRVRAYGRTTQAALDRLKDGVTVEGVRYGAVEARLDKAKEGREGANLWITVTLHEGKNREVRRVLESIGLKVNRLIRLAYGPLALGTLDVGEVEEVGPRVVREQFAAHIDPANLPTGERPQYRSAAKKARRAAEAPAAPQPAPQAKPEKKTYKAGWAKAKPKARPHPPPKRKSSAAPQAPLRDSTRPREAVAERPSPLRGGGGVGVRAERRLRSREREVGSVEPARSDLHLEGQGVEASRKGNPGNIRRRADTPTPTPPRKGEGRTKAASAFRNDPPRQRKGASDAFPESGPEPGEERARGRGVGKGPKSAGSPRAAAPGPGPRGPKPSTSPRGKPGARRPGPPKPGGRGPRG
ncbi:pseudouridine synthase [Phenylobacterium sp. SCN 70-31]|uniref:pseudouridine synthase n=1 Tax=Phenylobacterium sp. SCN 70-31 TaxID=1660129 RepID=UPI000A920070|nr:pseudouridine synthase [Phenylobacterium sp. SCN 70-31]